MTINELADGIHELLKRVPGDTEVMIDVFEFNQFIPLIGLHIATHSRTKAECCFLSTGLDAEAAHANISKQAAEDGAEMAYPRV